MDAVLFGRFHTDELETISCKFTKLPEILGWDEGTSDEVKLVEVSNPFGVLLVGLLTLDGLDILRMGKTHINVIFEIIKNRNPVLSSGFHAYMIAIILDKPVVKLLDIRVNGRKRFLDVLGDTIIVGDYDSCNDNIFMDIKSTADGVFKLHHKVNHHLK